jgi:hypothetical protein
MDVAQIIEAFGGQDEAIAILGVSKATLYLWEEEGIPPKRWKHLAEIAKRLSVPGVTMDVLMQARPSRVRAPRAERAA